MVTLVSIWIGETQCHGIALSDRQVKDFGGEDVWAAIAGSRETRAILRHTTEGRRWIGWAARTDVEAAGIAEIDIPETA